ncbi:MAG: hypothetical protein HQL96_05750 [Magnetococcales bacterium]|nr:hypothetical protein [Magnetococcales bacterium]
MKLARLLPAILLILTAALATGHAAEEKCVAGDCVNGKGTYIYSDGSKYVGEYKNGKINGQGKFTYPDGSQYIGEYKNNKMNGQGTFIYPNGDKYVGEFNNNQMNDKGKFIPAAKKAGADKKTEASASAKEPEKKEISKSKPARKAVGKGKKKSGKKHYKKAKAKK